jgi:hypothetical protein
MTNTSAGAIVGRGAQRCRARPRPRPTRRRSTSSIWTLARIDRVDHRLRARRCPARCAPVRAITAAVGKPIYPSPRTTTLSSVCDTIRDKSPGDHLSDPLGCMAVAERIVGAGHGRSTHPCRPDRVEHFGNDPRFGIGPDRVARCPLRTPSGRSVVSRITSTGLASAGASSCTPPESVSAIALRSSARMKWG